jgi:enoyl-CoA hydratase/carnithine racemase
MAAHEAGQLGLAELVVPGAELDGAVDDLVAGLLTADADAARATKELLTQAQGHTLDQQAAAERRSQAALQRARLGR